MDILLAFLVFWGPVLALSLLSLFWAKRSRVNWLRRPLRWGAFFWMPVLAISIARVIGVATTCTGNALSIHAGCTFVQFDLSHGATPIVLLIYAAAAFYFAALFLIGFIAEVRAIPQS